MYKNKLKIEFCDIIKERSLVSNDGNGKQKLGCIIYSKIGKKIYYHSNGLNLYNINNDERKTIHAEVCAVEKLKFTRNRKRINIFIFRTNNDGNKCNMARPCYSCIFKMYKICKYKNYTINHIYYTDWFGNVQKYTY